MSLAASLPISRMRTVGTTKVQGRGAQCLENGSDSVGELRNAPDHAPNWVFLSGGDTIDSAKTKRLLGGINGAIEGSPTVSGPLFGRFFDGEPRYKNLTKRGPNREPLFLVR